MPVSKEQLSFILGYISKKLRGNDRTDQYPAGLAEAKNCVIDIEGTVSRRPGTEQITDGSIDWTSNDEYVRLLPFKFSDQEQYVLVFKGNRNGQTQGTFDVVQDGVVYSNPEWKHPYEGSELTFDPENSNPEYRPGIKISQAGDFAVITHHNHPPQLLTRISANDGGEWELAPIQQGRFLAGRNFSVKQISGGSSNALEYKFEFRMVGVDQTGKYLPFAEINSNIPSSIEFGDRLEDKEFRIPQTTGSRGIQRGFRGLFVNGEDFYFLGFKTSRQGSYAARASLFKGNIDSSSPPDSNGVFLELTDPASSIVEKFNASRRPEGNPPDIYLAGDSNRIFMIDGGRASSSEVVIFNIPTRRFINPTTISPSRRSIYSGDGRSNLDGIAVERYSAVSTKFMAVSGGYDRIMAYSATTISRLSSSEDVRFAESERNDDEIKGMCESNDYWHVLNATTKQIFAYNKTTKLINESLTIDLHEDNKDPVDCDFSRGIIYVLDSGRNQLDQDWQVSYEHTRVFAYYFSGVIDIPAASIIAKRDARLELTWEAGNSPPHRYLIFQKAEGNFGLVGSTKRTSLVIQNLIGDERVGLPVLKNPFATHGNPQCSTVFQQRRAFANFDFDSPRDKIEERNRIVLSRIGEFFSFDTHSPIQADDSIDIVLAANEVNDIRHLITVREAMFVLTGGSMWVVRGDSGGVVSPATINAELEQSYGSSHLQPIIVGQSLLHVSQRNRRVFTTNYSYNLASFQTRELSVAFADLLEDQDIVSWDYVDGHLPLLIMVLDNGKMLCVTYSEELGIVSAAQWEFAGATAKQVSISNRSDNNEPMAIFLVEKNGAKQLWKMAFSDVKTWADADGNVFEMVVETLPHWQLRPTNFRHCWLRVEFDCSLEVDDGHVNRPVSCKQDKINHVQIRKADTTKPCIKIVHQTNEKFTLQGVQISDEYSDTTETGGGKS